MKYTEHKPCRALMPHVECIWFATDDQVSTTRAAERVLPDGCMEWIFHLGECFSRWSSAGEWEVQPRSFFVGELTRFLLIQPGKTLATMGVRFRPHSAYRFLPLSAHLLTDGTVSTRDIWGPEGAFLEEAVVSANSDRERKQLVETFLWRRLLAAEVRSRFEFAVGRVMSSRGQLRVDRLAETVGWSRRQLEREFQSGVGLAPKAFARIVRFQNLLLLLGENNLREWAALAQAVGYADQSHMIREFREFCGQSPTQHPISRVGELARHFVSPHRLTKLLGPES